MPDVEHIVIYMQENHSFDNYFGMLGRGDGFTLDAKGRPTNSNPGLDGKPLEREAAGFHARVVQHECDHLDGILYPQRMTDHRLLVFTEELQRHPIDLAEFFKAEVS